MSVNIYQNKKVIIVLVLLQVQYFIICKFSTKQTQDVSGFIELSLECAVALNVLGFLLFQRTEKFRLGCLHCVSMYLTMTFQIIIMYINLTRNCTFWLLHICYYLHTVFMHKAGNTHQDKNLLCVKCLLYQCVQFHFPQPHILFKEINTFSDSVLPFSPIYKH